MNQATTNRPYQVTSLAGIGGLLSQPRRDPEVDSILIAEVVTRMSNATKNGKTIQTLVSHFLDFHFKAYEKEPTPERRHELLAMMAAYEDIANNS